MLVTFIAILLLIFLSGVFSASETAFIASSKAKIHAMKKNGESRAEIVIKLQSDINNFLSFILLFNNIINILAASLSTMLFTDLFGDMGVFLSTLVMSFMVVVFAELMPKIGAIVYAEKIAIFMAPIFMVMVNISKPVTKFIEMIAKKTLDAFGLRRIKSTDSDSFDDELRSFIDMNIAKDRRSTAVMLKNILDLCDVEVGEIMIHRKNVFSIDAEEKTSKILETMINIPYTRIPIWKDSPDNIIGILHVRSLIKAVREHPLDIDSLDVVKIAQDPWFVPETTSLLSQLHAFRKKKEHSALIVDEYGAFQGLVTLEDILEEIVGEIIDELDKQNVNIVKESPTKRQASVVVDGKATIRDINRDYGWEIPDDKASTIAGLLLYETGRIPNIGTVVHIGHFNIRVLRRSRNQITQVKISPTDTEKVM